MANQAQTWLEAIKIMEEHKYRKRSGYLAGTSNVNVDLILLVMGNTGLGT